VALTLTRLVAAASVVALERPRIDVTGPSWPCQTVAALHQNIRIYKARRSAYKAYNDLGMITEKV
jgi:hypothetical protein